MNQSPCSSSVGGKELLCLCGCYIYPRVFPSEPRQPFRGLEFLKLQQEKKKNILNTIHFGLSSFFIFLFFYFIYIYILFFSLHIIYQYNKKNSIKSNISYPNLKKMDKNVSVPVLAI